MLPLERRMSALGLAAFLGLGCSAITNASAPPPGLLASGEVNPVTVTAGAPTSDRAFADSVRRTDIPALTPTPTYVPDFRTELFAGPILEAIRGSAPFFYDDFSTNTGWRATQDGGQWPPEWMSIENGWLEALDDGARTYTHMTNPKTDGVYNYVLMVEASFLRSAATVARVRSIGVCWQPGNERGGRFLVDEAGWVEGTTCDLDGCTPGFAEGRFRPLGTTATLTITLIHRNGESAIYLDGHPLMYYQVENPSRWTGFSLCPQTFDDFPSAIGYDNVRVWRLEE